MTGITKRKKIKTVLKGKKTDPGQYIIIYDIIQISIKTE